MARKSKSNRNKSYVEVRNLARKKRIEDIVFQLGPKDRQEIIARTGLSVSAVYKALNPNDSFWSATVIHAAEEFINARTAVEL